MSSSPRRETHVLFDFDGTLVDSLRLLIDLYNEAARRNGWHVLEKAQLEAFRAMSLRERFAALEIPMYRLPLLGRELKKEYALQLGKVTWISGMRETLLSLRDDGHVLGIVSSNSADTIRAFLTSHGMDTFSTVESVRGLFGKHRVLGRYLATRGLDERQAVYVGDEQRDLEAARKAGLRSVAVTWGADLEERLRAYRPTELARTPRELRETLSRLLRN